MFDWVLNTRIRLYVLNSLEQYLSKNIWIKNVIVEIVIKINLSKNSS